jgi:hypothetical protein
MVAAAGADELKHVGVAVFEAAVHDAVRLAPQERRPAVAGLTGKRRYQGAVGRDAQPRVTAIVRARCGDGGRADSRPGARVARTAHSTHRQAVVPAAAGVCCNEVHYHEMIHAGAAQRMSSRVG